MENSYEMMLITSPTLPEKDEKKLTDKIGEMIADAGKIIKFSNLGRKQFAYRIKKENSGNYWLYDMKISTSKVSTLTPRLSREENVLRFLILKKEK